MSNSASIAAAKRRRGVSQNTPVSNNSASKNINRVNSEPTLEVSEKTRQKINPLQILGMHENRLEFLEKHHNTMAMALNKYPNPNEEKIVTLKDLEEFRQAFQKISNIDRTNNVNANNSNNQEIDVNKIKREVSEEFLKNEMTKLVTKSEIENIIASVKTEVVTENIKKLEAKINEIREMKSQNQVNTNTDVTISQEEIEKIEKKLTEKLDSSISKSVITEKHLDDLKTEIVKKVELINLSKDYITRKEYIEMKNILSSKINDLKNKPDTNQKEIETLQKTMTKKIEDSIPKNIIGTKEIQDLKKELTTEITNKINGIPKFNMETDKTYTNMKTKIETLESKVKALEQLVLKK